MSAYLPPKLKTELKAKAISKRVGTTAYRTGYPKVAHLPGNAAFALVTCILLATNPWNTIIDEIVAHKYSTTWFQTSILSGMLTIAVGLWTSKTVYIRVFGNQPWRLLGFFLVVLVSTMYNNNITELIVFIKYISYYLLYLLTLASGLNERQIKLCIYSYATSVVVVGVVSLVDYNGLHDFSNINEKMVSKVYVEELNATVRGMTGPFESRTQFASYLCLAFGITAAKFLGQKVRIGYRLCWAVSTAILSASIMQSTSRNAYISIVITIMYLLWVKVHKISVSELFSLICSMGMSILVFAVIFSQSKSEITLAVKKQIQNLGKSEIMNSESDMVRFALWEAVIKKAFYQPFGEGFKQEPILPSYVLTNTHSNILWFLKIGGLFGFGFFIWFLIPLIRCGWRNIKNPGVMPLFAAGLSIFIYGLTHTCVGWVNLWIFVGLFQTSSYINEKTTFYIINTIK